MTDFNWALLLAVAVPLVLLWHARGSREIELRQQDALDRIDDMVEQSRAREEALHNFLQSPWVRLADFTEGHDNIRVWVYRIGPEHPWEAKVILPDGKGRYECFDGSGSTASEAIGKSLEAAQSRETTAPHNPRANP